MALADLWPAWRSEWVLYEDDDLIVVDKPAGISTHAPDPVRVDDAHGRLSAWLASRGGPKPYLGIHQRLDRDTSGVLLFTRRKEANAAIARQFEGRSVQKVYVAAVRGVIAAPRGKRARDSGVLEHRLAPADGGRMRVVPPGARGGQDAVTRFRLLERHGDRALYELSPVTGRTHQIRVQLAAVGAPVAGDEVYGGPPAPRLLLHAAALTIEHRGHPETFRSAPPPELGDWARGVAGGLPTSVDHLEVAMRAAADRRYAVSQLPGTDAFRLVHGAGDGLPGVTLDVYGEHLVVALVSDEASARRDEILDAAARLGANGVYLKVRPRHASRVVDTRRDELAPREASRGESAPEAFVVHELGLPYEVRLGDGLSTGIFLDQRENRRRVRELARGARVCNLFAYTGPFTVAAAAGGARRTATVDVSRTALAWARRNLDGIGAPVDPHELVEADVLAWLKQAATDPARRFDLVICDPPSFATTKQGTFSVESDYKKLAAACFAVLAPGGKLLACTNHRGLLRAKLRRYLHEAARAAAREVTQLKDLPAPVDFPPEPGAEPHLKSLLCTVA